MLDGSEDELFSVGQRIRHNVLGSGTIEALDMDKLAYLIRFDGLRTPRKISFKIQLIGINDKE